MSCLRKPAQYGFTLFELAVVLAIVGLLFGAIVAGEGLLQTARIQAQIQQLKTFDVAVSTFEFKYNCLPGDCPDGVSLGLQSDDGNGDLMIDGSEGATDETANFFEALSRARLTEDFYDNNCHPISPLDETKVIGADGYASLGNQNYWLLVVDARTEGGVLGCGGILSAAQDSLSGAEALSLDETIDDGKPYSGAVLLVFDDEITNDVDMGNYVDGTDDADVSCASNPTFGTDATYLVDEEGYNCPVIVRIGAI